MPDYKTALWGASEPPPARPPLDHDIAVDVAVVGAGITGITAAYLLKQAGLKVAVLESRRVGSGETKRSTAHLTEVLDCAFGCYARASAAAARSWRWKGTAPPSTRSRSWRAR